MWPFLTPLLQKQKFQFGKNSFEADILLEIAPEGSSHARISITQNRQTKTEIIDSPYEKLVMKDRQLQYFAERALLFWKKQTM